MYFTDRHERPIFERIDSRKEQPCICGVLIIAQINKPVLSVQPHLLHEFPTFSQPQHKTVINVQETLNRNTQYHKYKPILKFFLNL